MDTRLAMRLVLAAAAFSMMGIAPVVADDCKSPVTAEGKPAKLRDLGAYPNSLFAWRAAVKEKYGHEFNSWRYAKDRDVTCDERGGEWVCKRTAAPCKDLLHRTIGTATAAIAKNCQSEQLSSYGRREKTEDAAIEQAMWGWRIDARKKYSEEWAVWENATDTDIDCNKLNAGMVQCVAVGTACAPK